MVPIIRLRRTNSTVGVNQLFIDAQMEGFDALSSNIFVFGYGFGGEKMSVFVVFGGCSEWGGDEEKVNRGLLLDFTFMGVKYFYGYIIYLFFLSDFLNTICKKIIVYLFLSYIFSLFF